MIVANPLSASLSALLPAYARWGTIVTSYLGTLPCQPVVGRYMYPLIWQAKVSYQLNLSSYIWTTSFRSVFILTSLSHPTLRQPTCFDLDRRRSTKRLWSRADSFSSSSAFASFGFYLENSFPSRIPNKASKASKASKANLKSALPHAPPRYLVTFAVFLTILRYFSYRSASFPTTSLPDTSIRFSTEMSPTGPQAGGSGSTARNKHQTRASTRGGSIQKRRAATRVDRDGDISMGAASAGASAGARGSGRAGPSKRGSMATRSSTRTAQNLVLYGQGDLALLASRGGRGGRVSINPSKARFAHTAILKVHGLNESKAATNSDGGLRSLLTFLERKASKGDKQITIQKVRPHIVLFPFHSRPAQSHTCD